MSIADDLEAELRQALASTETTLSKYIEHVGRCEGTDFIDGIENSISAIAFSADEIATLTRLREYKEPGETE